MFGLKFMFVFVWVNVIFLVLFFLNQGGTKLNNLLWKSTCRWALNHRQKKLTPAKNMSRGTLPSTKNNTELTDNFFWWPGGIERGTKHESLKVLWFWVLVALVPFCVTGVFMWAVSPTKTMHMFNQGECNMNGVPYPTNLNKFRCTFGKNVASIDGATHTATCFDTIFSASSYDPNSGVRTTY